MIVLRSLTKTYGRGRRRRYILKDVDAVFSPLQHYVILGMPKVGKSTLLNLISGVQRPTRGGIRHNGKVGIPVGCASLLTARYSAREVASIFATLYGADAREVSEFAADFSGLGSNIRRPIEDLDQEERNRFYVTLSYALPVDYYLFDGSVGTGDAEFRRRCRAAFDERRKEAGTIYATSNPREVENFGNRGGVLYNGKLELFENLEEAVERYRQVQCESTAGASSYVHILVRDGKRVEARKYLREYIERQGDDITAKLYLADLMFDDGDYAHASVLCKSMLEQAPNEAAVHFLLAKIAEREGRLDEAIDRTQYVLEIAPGHPRARSFMASIYEAAGRDNEAAAIWRDMAAGHNNFRLWSTAIRADMKAGNWEHVLSNVERATAIAGASGAVALQNVRLRALLELGRIADVQTEVAAMASKDAEKAADALSRLAKEGNGGAIAGILAHVLKSRPDINLTGRSVRLLAAFLQKEARLTKQGHSDSVSEIAAWLAKQSNNRPPIGAG